jgi:uncharacterized RDD family membrane protein YckC
MSHESTSREIPLGQYAGFVTRLVAWTIDRFLLTAFISVSGAVIGFLGETLGINRLLGLSEGIRLLVLAVGLVLAVMVPISYNIACWMLAGQTAGKWVMGLRVVRTDGQRVRFWAAVRRQIGYWISGILFLGYVWILFDNRRQGFHDKLAGTFVVYAWPEVAQPMRPIQDPLREARIEGRLATKQG